MLQQTSWHRNTTVEGAAGEENYRQLISRVKSRQDAILALNVLSQGRKERAVLQQHVPFTFHTSQAFIQVCNMHICAAGTQQLPVGSDTRCCSFLSSKLWRQSY